MSRLRLVAAVLALLVAVACVVAATSERTRANDSLQVAGPS